MGGLRGAHRGLADLCLRAGGVPLTLSVPSTVYFFFRVPAWCGASGREGTCRNNSKGVLMGCHLRQHKWRKFKLVVVRER